MKEITLTQVQIDAASDLNEGRVLYAYLDGTSVRMETENGADPYVWRGGKWIPMKFE